MIPELAGETTSPPACVSIATTERGTSHQQEIQAVLDQLRREAVDRDAAYNLLKAENSAQGAQAQRHAAAPPSPATIVIDENGDQNNAGINAGAHTPQPAGGSVTGATE